MHAGSNGSSSNSRSSTIAGAAATTTEPTPPPSSAAPPSPAAAAATANANGCEGIAPTTTTAEDEDDHDIQTIINQIRQQVHVMVQQQQIMSAQSRQQAYQTAATADAAALARSSSRTATTTAHDNNDNNDRRRRHQQQHNAEQEHVSYVHLGIQPLPQHIDRQFPPMILANSHLADTLELDAALIHLKPHADFFQPQRMLAVFAALVQQQYLAPIGISPHAVIRLKNRQQQSSSRSTAAATGRPGFSSSNSANANNVTAAAAIAEKWNDGDNLAETHRGILWRRRKWKRIIAKRQALEAVLRLDPRNHHARAKHLKALQRQAALATDVLHHPWLLVHHMRCEMFNLYCTSHVRMLHRKYSSVILCSTSSGRDGGAAENVVVDRHGFPNYHKVRQRAFATMALDAKKKFLKDLWRKTKCVMCAIRRQQKAYKEEEQSGRNVVKAATTKDGDNNDNNMPGAGAETDHMEKGIGLHHTCISPSTHINPWIEFNELLTGDSVRASKLMAATQRLRARMPGCGLRPGDNQRIQVIDKLVDDVKVAHDNDSKRTSCAANKAALVAACALHDYISSEPQLEATLLDELSAGHEGDSDESVPEDIYSLAASLPPVKGLLGIDARVPEPVRDRFSLSNMQNSLVWGLQKSGGTDSPCYLDEDDDEGRLEAAKTKALQKAGFLPTDVPEEEKETKESKVPSDDRTEVVTPGSTNFVTAAAAPVDRNERKEVSLASSRAAHREDDDVSGEPGYVPPLLRFNCMDLLWVTLKEAEADALAAVEAAVMKKKKVNDTYQSPATELLCHLQLDLLRRAHARIELQVMRESVEKKGKTVYGRNGEAALKNQVLDDIQVPVELCEYAVALAKASLRIVDAVVKCLRATDGETSCMRSYADGIVDVLEESLVWKALPLLLVALSVTMRKVPPVRKEFESGGIVSLWVTLLHRVDKLAALSPAVKWHAQQAVDITNETVSQGIAEQVSVVQSPHVYWNTPLPDQTVHFPGASMLVLHFDARCHTEQGRDMLHILDAHDRPLIEKPLHGQPEMWPQEAIVLHNTDTVKFRFVVTSALREGLWGFMCTVMAYVLPVSMRQPYALARSPVDLASRLKMRQSACSFADARRQRLKKKYEEEVNFEKAACQRLKSGECLALGKDVSEMKSMEKCVVQFVLKDGETGPEKAAKSRQGEEQTQKPSTILPTVRRYAKFMEFVKGIPSFSALVKEADKKKRKEMEKKKGDDEQKTTPQRTEATSSNSDDIVGEMRAMRRATAGTVDKVLEKVKAEPPPASVVAALDERLTAIVSDLKREYREKLKGIVASVNEREDSRADKIPYLLLDMPEGNQCENEASVIGSTECDVETASNHASSVQDNMSSPSVDGTGGGFVVDLACTLAQVIGECECALSSGDQVTLKEKNHASFLSSPTLFAHVTDVSLRQYLDKTYQQSSKEACLSRICAGGYDSFLVELVTGTEGSFAARLDSAMRAKVGTSMTDRLGGNTAAKTTRAFISVLLHVMGLTSMAKQVASSLPDALPADSVLKVFLSIWKSGQRFRASLVSGKQQAQQEFEARLVELEGIGGEMDATERNAMEVRGTYEGFCRPILDKCEFLLLHAGSISKMNLKRDGGDDGDDPRRDSSGALLLRCQSEPTSEQLTSGVPQLARVPSLEYEQKSVTVASRLRSQRSNMAHTSSSLNSSSGQDVTKPNGAMSNFQRALDDLMVMQTFAVERREFRGTKAARLSAPEFIADQITQFLRSSTPLIEFLELVHIHRQRARRRANALSTFKGAISHTRMLEVACYVLIKAAGSTLRSYGAYESGSYGAEDFCPPKVNHTHHSFPGGGHYLRNVEACGYNLERELVTEAHALFSQLFGMLSTASSPQSVGLDTFVLYAMMADWRREDYHFLAKQSVLDALSRIALVAGSGGGKGEEDDDCRLGMSLPSSFHACLHACLGYFESFSFVSPRDTGEAHRKLGDSQFHYQVVGMSVMNVRRSLANFMLIAESLECESATSTMLFSDQTFCGAFDLGLRRELSKSTIGTNMMEQTRQFVDAEECLFLCLGRFSSTLSSSMIISSLSGNFTILRVALGSLRCGSPRVQCLALRVLSVLLIQCSPDSVTHLVKCCAPEESGGDIIAVLFSLLGKCLMLQVPNNASCEADVAEYEKSRQWWNWRNGEAVMILAGEYAGCLRSLIYAAQWETHILSVMMSTIMALSKFLQRGSSNTGRSPADTSSAAVVPDSLIESGLAVMYVLGGECLVPYAGATVSRSDPTKEQDITGSIGDSIDASLPEASPALSASVSISSAASSSSNTRFLEPPSLATRNGRLGTLIEYDRRAGTGAVVFVSDPSRIVRTDAVDQLFMVSRVPLKHSFVDSSLATALFDLLHVFARTDASENGNIDASLRRKRLRKREKVPSTPAVGASKPSTEDPPPAASPQESQWPCPVCTFLNPLIRPTCEMCGTNNPQFFLKRKTIVDLDAGNGGGADGRGGHADEGVEEENMYPVSYPSLTLSWLRSRTLAAICKLVVGAGSRAMKCQAERFNMLLAVAVQPAPFDTYMSIAQLEVMEVRLVELLHETLSVCGVNGSRATKRPLKHSPFYHLQLLLPGRVDLQSARGLKFDEGDGRHCRFSASSCLGGVAKADHAVPSSLPGYYFEVTIENVAEGKQGRAATLRTTPESKKPQRDVCSAGFGVSVGVVRAGLGLDIEPGLHSSFAFGGSPGKLHVTLNKKVEHIGDFGWPNLSVGDTVGCGISVRFKERSLFWTVNGTLLAEDKLPAHAGAALKCLSGSFVPAIWVDSLDMSVTVNFGQDPFVYSFEDSHLDAAYRVELENGRRAYDARSRSSGVNGGDGGGVRSELLIRRRTAAQELVEIMGGTYPVELAEIALERNQDSMQAAMSFLLDHGMRALQELGAQHLREQEQESKRAAERARRGRGVDDESDDAASCDSDDEGTLAEFLESGGGGHVAHDERQRRAERAATYLDDEIEQTIPVGVVVPPGHDDNAARRWGNGSRSGDSRDGGRRLQEQMEGLRDGSSVPGFAAQVIPPTLVVRDHISIDTVQVGRTLRVREDVAEIVGCQAFASLRNNVGVVSGVDINAQLVTMVFLNSLAAVQKSVSLPISALYRSSYTWKEPCAALVSSLRRSMPKRRDAGGRETQSASYNSDWQLYARALLKTEHALSIRRVRSIVLDMMREKISADISLTSLFQLLKLAGAEQLCSRSSASGARNNGESANFGLRSSLALSHIKSAVVRSLEKESVVFAAKQYRNLPALRLNERLYTEEAKSDANNSGDDGSELVSLLEEGGGGSFLVQRLAEECILHFVQADIAPPVRVIRSSHPYESNVEVSGRVRIDGATKLLVRFDPRCSMATDYMTRLSLFRDEKHMDTIVSLSGSGKGPRGIFSPLVVSGDTFWYKFTSGTNSHLWGYKFRVEPLELHVDDFSALNSQNFALGSWLFSLALDHAPTAYFGDIFDALVWYCVRARPAEKTKAVVLLVQLIMRKRARSAVDDAAGIISEPLNFAKLRTLSDDINSYVMSLKECDLRDNLQSSTLQSFVELLSAVDLFSSTSRSVPSARMVQKEKEGLSCAISLVHTPEKDTVQANDVTVDWNTFAVPRLEIVRATLSRTATSAKVISSTVDITAALSKHLKRSGSVDLVLPVDGRVLRTIPGFDSGIDLRTFKCFEVKYRVIVQCIDWTTGMLHSKTIREGTESWNCGAAAEPFMISTTCPIFETVVRVSRFSLNEQCGRSHSSGKGAQTPDHDLIARSNAPVIPDYYVHACIREHVTSNFGYSLVSVHGFLSHMRRCRRGVPPCLTPKAEWSVSFFIFLEPPAIFSCPVDVKKGISDTPRMILHRGSYVDASKLPIIPDRSKEGGSWPRAGFSIMVVSSNAGNVNSGSVHHSLVTYLYNNGHRTAHHYQSARLLPKTWHHVCLRASTNEGLKVYIDGKLCGSGGVLGMSVLGEGHPFFVGKLPPGYLSPSVKGGDDDTAAASYFDEDIGAIGFSGCIKNCRFYPYLVDSSFVNEEYERLATENGVCEAWQDGDDGTGAFCFRKSGKRCSRRGPRGLYPAASAASENSDFSSSLRGASKQKVCGDRRNASAVVVPMVTTQTLREFGTALDWRITRSDAHLVQLCRHAVDKMRSSSSSCFTLLRAGLRVLPLEHELFSVVTRRDAKAPTACDESKDGKAVAVGARGGWQWNDGIISVLKRFPSLEHMHPALLCFRFALLRYVNDRIASVLPLVDFTHASSSWSLAGRLRSLAPIIMMDIKNRAWRRILKETATPSGRFSVTINRPLAVRARNEQYPSGSSDGAGAAGVGESSSAPIMSDASLLKSNLGQAYAQMHFIKPAKLRCHTGGRPFNVRFAGEGGIDAGGLFRDLLNDICIDFQANYLPLCILSPNSEAGMGEKVILNPGARSPLLLSMYAFIGKLMGLAIRGGHMLNLDLPSVVWKPLVGDPVERCDLASINSLSLNVLQSMERLNEDEKVEECTFNAATANQAFVTVTTNGKEVELKPGGKDIPVTWRSRDEFLRLEEKFRLEEFMLQTAAIRSGLATVVPVQLLSLFTWSELEVMVCGERDVDVDYLQRNTIYGSGVKADDAHVKMLFQVLREMSSDDQRRFLRFVWGQSRLPYREEDFTQKFRINSAPRDDDVSLPLSHNCFFQLDLPRYSSVEVMRKKLNYAIRHCVTVDMDTQATREAWE